MRFSILGAALLLAAGTSAEAAVIVFDFDDLGEQVDVPEDYKGGIWTGFRTAAGFGNPSLPNLAYNSAADGVAVFTYAAGFTSLNFSAGVFSDALVRVYAGPGGLGELLATVLITNPPANPFAFAPYAVPFAGTARSVVLSGVSQAVGWDDVTITTADGAIPEPATWAMLIAGFGLVGAAVRGRRKRAAA
jgi:hypothetical protein